MAEAGGLIQAREPPFDESSLLVQGAGRETSGIRLPEQTGQASSPDRGDGGGTEQTQLRRVGVRFEIRRHCLPGGQLSQPTDAAFLQCRDAAVRVLRQPIDHLAQAGAVHVGLGLPETHDVAAIDGRPAVVECGQAGQRLVDGGVGGGGDEDSLPHAQQREDDVGQRGGFTRAWWSPDEGRCRPSAEVDGPTLALVERVGQVVGVLAAHRQLASGSLPE